MNLYLIGRIFLTTTILLVANLLIIATKFNYKLNY